MHKSVVASDSKTISNTSKVDRSDTLTQFAIRESVYVVLNPKMCSRTLRVHVPELISKVAGHRVPEVPHD